MTPPHPLALTSYDLMAEKPQTQTPDTKPAAPESAAVAITGPVAPKRGPGHRGADVRDTVAEMAARAQEISQEAGSKMASAMRDVISAAAGLAGFSVESARDLVQYMVRRGQMTQEEADRLIREAEDAASKRKVNLPPPPSKQPKPVIVPPTPPVAAPVAVAVAATAAPEPIRHEPPRHEPVHHTTHAPAHTAHPVHPVHPVHHKPAVTLGATQAPPQKKAAAKSASAKKPAKPAAKAVKKSAKKR
jgi:polyhydroxyalkanoate synthesis regulator phasin